MVAAPGVSKAARGGGDRRRLAHRAPPDYSRQLRRAFQLAFLALNIWIGIEFYFFVRFYETGSPGFLPRPAGVEGWLPIAGLMNLRQFLGTGKVPVIHPAAMFLLAGFIAMSLLLRKAFCGWLCPVGTVSEYLWRAGRRVFGRNLTLPRWADLPFRSLKYVLLGLFLWVIGGMSAAAVEAFMSGPYGVIADVKMLNFFRHMSATAAVVLGLLAIASVFVQNFWCRYLCPYGALLGLFSTASPLRIQRDGNLCIDCAKCAKACPSQLPVDKLVNIKSAECTACLECVAACPAAGALELGAAGVRRRVPAWALAAGIVILFLGITGYAKWSGHWQTHVPPAVYRELVPHAGEFAHPY